MYDVLMTTLGLWLTTNMFGIFFVPLILWMHFDIWYLSDLIGMYSSLIKSANILGYFIITIITLWFLPSLLITILIMILDFICLPKMLDIIKKIAFNKK